MTSEKKKWACPKCDAPHAAHGKGGAKKCHDPLHTDAECQGFICDCDAFDDASDQHGESFSDICFNAVCYHCGWSGQMPEVPKKVAPWEKKALLAGWMPPESRKKELGLD